MDFWGYAARDCYFVVDRATKVDNQFRQTPVYGIGRYLTFVERILFYIKNRKMAKDFFREGVTIYMPFSFRFSSYSYNEYVYFEEGLSSYRKAEPCIHRNSLVLALRKMVVCLFAPFDRQIKGYLMGFVCQEKKPLNKSSLVSLSVDCYRYVTDPLVKKLVIPVPKIVSTKGDIMPNSVIFVMDRLSVEGRPFALENYKECVINEVEKLQKEGVRQIYVKYHPQDYNNESSKGWIEGVFRDFGLDYKLIDERLEYIALQNIGTRFVGTNSTILYYAPLLGNTNKSESFYRNLVARDKQYKSFIEGWNEFDCFFSKNVECI